MRTIIFWGLYWGHSILGNYRFVLNLKRVTLDLCFGSLSTSVEGLGLRLWEAGRNLGCHGTICSISRRR